MHRFYRMVSSERIKWIFVFVEMLKFYYLTSNLLLNGSDSSNSIARTFVTITNWISALFDRSLVWFSLKWFFRPTFFVYSQVINKLALYLSVVECGTNRAKRGKIGKPRKLIEQYIILINSILVGNFICDIFILIQIFIIFAFAHFAQAPLSLSHTLHGI